VKNLDSLANFVKPPIELLANKTNTQKRMAAANLQLSPTLISTFEQSQTDGTRWLTCTITDVTFEFATKGKSSGNLEVDLQDVKKVLASTKDGLMVLVCVDEASKPKKWTIVAYVPETCKIKKRMLFASGRADIKTKLGQSYFKGGTSFVNVSIIHIIIPGVLTKKRTNHPHRQKFTQLNLLT
jgi:hypothetical protein